MAARALHASLLTAEHTITSNIFEELSRNVSWIKCQPTYNKKSFTESVSTIIKIIENTNGLHSMQRRCILVLELYRLLGRARYRWEKLTNFKKTVYDKIYELEAEGIDSEIIQELRQLVGYRCRDAEEIDKP
jgi:hypothetical protein